MEHVLHIREVLGSNIDPTIGCSLMTEVFETLRCALTQMSTSTLRSALATCLAFAVHYAAVSDWTLCGVAPPFDVMRCCTVIGRYAVLRRHWTLCGVAPLFYLTNIAGNLKPLFQSVCVRPLSYLPTIYSMGEPTGRAIHMSHKLSTLYNVMHWGRR
jgi:hypothetical protein